MARARKEGKSTRNRGNQVKRNKIIEKNIEILNRLKKELKEKEANETH